MNNKSILVTGGTGSFGIEFIKTLQKKFKPKKIIIFSRDEFKQSNLMKTFNQKNIRFFLGDVRDKNRLIQAAENVDVIVHAAALKQVPAAEYNPQEFIKTNIIGAQNVIDAALINNVKKILALSTDKAVNPINLYGSTKLCSDKLFVAANNMSGNKKCIFSVVRYGNVSNSRGSVIPLLKDQNKNNSNFTITHKDMTRFSITLKEGVDFVINGLKLMKGGEIFIPKIPSVKIIDIAKTINKNRKIKYIGIRPGEKLHELLISKDDNQGVIEFKKYYIIKSTININRTNINFNISSSGEKGKVVDENFEYNSKNNIYFLNTKEIKKLIN